MNNHLIVCVLALVGCLAVPLGGQGLSTSDRQYVNETEAPPPDECQSFEGAVLATVRTYYAALFARASRPATVLGILDDNDVLNPIRNHHSAAHPRNDLLGEPEAELVCDTVRVLLRYLEGRLQTT